MRCAIPTSLSIASFVTASLVFNSNRCCQRRLLVVRFDKRNCHMFADDWKWRVSFSLVYIFTLYGNDFRMFNNLRDMHVPLFTVLQDAKLIQAGARAEGVPSLPGSAFSHIVSRLSVLRRIKIFIKNGLTAV